MEGHIKIYHATPHYHVTKYDSLYKAVYIFTITGNFNRNILNHHNVSFVISCHVRCRLRHENERELGTRNGYTNPMMLCGIPLSDPYFGEIKKLGGI